jgi:hypothetical protein
MDSKNEKRQEFLLYRSRFLWKVEDFLILEALRQGLKGNRYRYPSISYIKSLNIFSKGNFGNFGKKNPGLDSDPAKKAFTRLSINPDPQLCLYPYVRRRRHLLSAFLACCSRSFCSLRSSLALIRKSFKHHKNSFIEVHDQQILWYQPSLK